MSKTYFDKSHWVNPRSTIASVYDGNDYGYVFHAASILVDILRVVNLPMGEFAELKILDYGCGTGRVTRQLALTGASVEGYDPVPECIAESVTEGSKIGTRFREPRIITDSLDDISDNFDLIVCVNVLEHLDDARLASAIATIESKLSVTGEAILWVHKFKNSDFLAQHAIIAPTKSGNIQIVKGKNINGTVRYSLYSK